MHYTIHPASGRLYAAVWFHDGQGGEREVAVGTIALVALEVLARELTDAALCAALDSVCLRATTAEALTALSVARDELIDRGMIRG